MSSHPTDKEGSELEAIEAFPYPLYQQQLYMPMYSTGKEDSELEAIAASPCPLFWQRLHMSSHPTDKEGSELEAIAAYPCPLFQQRPYISFQTTDKEGPELEAIAKHAIDHHVQQQRQSQDWRWTKIAQILDIARLRDALQKKQLQQHKNPIGKEGSELEAIAASPCPLA
jgi:hypothetical protein